MYKCQKRRNMYDWECGNFAIEKKILKKDETGNIFLVGHVIIKLLNLLLYNNFIILFFKIKSNIFLHFSLFYIKEKKSIYINFCIMDFLHALFCISCLIYYTITYTFNIT